MNRYIGFITFLLSLLDRPALGFSFGTQQLITPLQSKRSLTTNNKIFRPSLLLNAQRGNIEKPIRRHRKIWEKSKKAFAIAAVTLSSIGVSPAMAAPNNNIYVSSTMTTEAQTNDLTNTQESDVEESDYEGMEPEDSSSIDENQQYEDDDDDEDFDIDIAESDSPTKAKSDLPTRSWRDDAVTPPLKMNKVLIGIGAGFTLIFTGSEAWKRVTEDAYMKKAMKIQNMRKKQHEKELAAQAAKEAAEAEEEEEDEEDEDEDDDDNEEDSNNEDKNEADSDEIIPPTISKAEKEKAIEDEGRRLVEESLKETEANDDDDPDDIPGDGDEIARLNKLFGG